MTDRERLVEDLLREALYASSESYEDVVDEVREERGVVRVRLRGVAHGFEVPFEEREKRSVVAARLERKLRISREGPDRSRPPIEG